MERFLPRASGIGCRLISVQKYPALTVAGGPNSAERGVEAAGSCVS